jgi:hypothetical protein
MSRLGELPWPEDSLYSLVIRTDFTDDATWERVRSAIETPVPASSNGVVVGKFKPAVEFVADRRFEHLALAELLELAKADPTHSIAFLVDHETLSDAEHPILVVDLTEVPGRTFRVVPTAMWEVQTNLAIANTSWEDHADYADPRGIYRGL